MAVKNYEPFPGYRISPDGTDYQLFEREEDVPAGWLRETPESYAKKGLKPPERKAAGRPKKEVSDGEIDL